LSEPVFAREMASMDGNEEEEDIWEIDLDFCGLEPDECDENTDSDLTVGELMERRYLKAEREKELVR
jgi:hypothetical protein